ncbi:hypothetical protein HK097_007548 [Rhizophlyctis rosea]|uniref:Myb-like domain-containing protein n=1 Tax=Rhizophlyctis rosea TaxID=64517 RepID=A0AAD5X548_9FUNG|nr:hypothetical protein HK097_007548 [Rhizophlyctis rosea]
MGKRKIEAAEGTDANEGLPTSSSKQHKANPADVAEELPTPEMKLLANQTRRPAQYSRSTIQRSKPRSWSEEEERKFWKGVMKALSGRWQMVADERESRDSNKCHMHFQAFLKRGGVEL